jgi:hypothetical protein
VKQLDTDIEIDAAPARVWSVLSDLERYHEWNPFIVEAHGSVEEGARLRVRMAPPGGRAATLKPTVTAVESERVLEWWGHVGVRGVFDGRHRFELHPSNGGTRLTQSETFTGLLVPIFARSLDAHTAAGFGLMNTALKARAEQRSADGPR